jgi:hypothetical protein
VQNVGKITFEEYGGYKKVQIVTQDIISDNKEHAEVD